MNSISMTAPADVYRRRRAKVAFELSRPLVIFSGRARSRNYLANTFPFRASSHYLYFGGPPLEGAALLIEPGSDGESGCFLFRQPTSLDDAVWSGALVADSSLAHAAGIATASVRDADRIAASLAGRKARALCPPCLETVRWVETLGLTIAESEEMVPIVELRLVKDEYELKAMRSAASVSVEAHLAAMRAARPGGRESDSIAAYWSTVVRRGCDVSFTPNATVRGEVLHGGRADNVYRDGQLLLIDAGAEEPGGYACDITRTLPVNGVFTAIQRQLYDAVLRAQRAAITACVPGRRFRDIHDLASKVMCEGLVEAGLLKGDANALAQRGAHTMFFTHGLGHLIGLDVHDMEDFGDLAGYEQGRTRRPEFGDKFLRLDRDLAAGMTLTIEPGLYLVPALWDNGEMTSRFVDVVNRPAVEKLLALSFGGIRIEDTVHVRASGGPEVMTANLPTDGDAVAALAGR